MSKKTDLVSRLLDEVELRHPIPDAPLPGASLVEQGAVLALMRHMTQKQAEASVEALRTAYGDWNEVRVSQVQEIAVHLRTGSRKKGPELQRDMAPAAAAVRDYLQDVFQQTHGLDLEFLREDVGAGGKTIAEMTSLGMAGGAYLLWLAGGGAVPVHVGLVRLLDRLGLCARTTSMKKAREAIDPLVPSGRELAFTLVFHEIADRWSDPVEPIYMKVEALRATAAGKKAYLERLTTVKREAERRKRDEARRAVAEKKDAERRRREEERAKKRAEAEERRKAREDERRQKAAEREREREQKRREDEKRKAAANKVAEKKRASEAKKKAAKKKVKSGSASRSGGSASKSGGTKSRSKTSSGKRTKTSSSGKRTARKTTRRR